MKEKYLFLYTGFSTLDYYHKMSRRGRSLKPLSSTGLIDKRLLNKIMGGNGSYELYKPTEHPLQKLNIFERITSYDYYNKKNKNTLDSIDGFIIETESASLATYLRLNGETYIKSPGIKLKAVIGPIDYYPIIHEISNQRRILQEVITERRDITSSVSYTKTITSFINGSPYRFHNDRAKMINIIGQHDQTNNILNLFNQSSLLMEEVSDYLKHLETKKQKEEKDEEVLLNDLIKKHKNNILSVTNITD